MIHKHQSCQLLPHDAQIKLSDIAEEIIQEYNLHNKVTPNGWVYIQCSCGMYGLPQDNSLGHNLLEQCFNKARYHQSPIVPGLWKHDTCPIQFTLVVDNFGVKYTSQDDATHLIVNLK
ncbi:hypothetical protein ACHAW6_015173 [Cyclotella cf. meneghiniana]